MLSIITFKGISILLLFILIIVIPQLNLTNYPHSTIISKFLVFAYYCIGLFIINTLSCLKITEIKLTVSNIDIMFIAIFIYVIGNRYFFQLNYGFSIRFIELIGLSFLFIIFRTFNFKVYYWLFLATIISAIIQVVYGYFQLLGYYKSNHSGFKLTGSFFNPGPYAGFLISVFPIALGLYLFRKKVMNQISINLNLKKESKTTNFIKKTTEYIPFIGVITIISIIPITQSRASWLALIVSSILLLILRYKMILKKLYNSLSKLKKTTLIVSIISITIISLFNIYH